MTTSRPTAQIVWMTRRELPAILSIEERSFPVAWTEEDFCACLRQRNCSGLTAYIDDVPIGFMIYEIANSHAHIMNFAVDPSCRRLGIGREMVAKLVAKLSQQRRTQITLEVRESNLDAQLFFRACGFTASGVARGFYEATDEDAYLFVRGIEL